jgi:hypothetical protein
MWRRRRRALSSTRSGIGRSRCHPFGCPSAARLSLLQFRPALPLQASSPWLLRLALTHCYHPLVLFPDFQSTFWGPLRLPIGCPC